MGAHSNTVYHTLAGTTAALMLLAALPTAQATTHATIYDVCQLNGISTVTAHVVGTFTTETKKNDFITDEIDIPHNDGWLCTRHSNRSGLSTLQVGLDTSPLPNPWLAANFVNAPAYTLYKTKGHEDPGYIMQRRLVITLANGQHIESEWLPLHKHKLGIQQKMPLTLANKDTYRVSIETKLALVKWGNKTPKINAPLYFKAATFNYWTGTAKVHGHSQLLDTPGTHHTTPAHPQRATWVRVWFNRLDKTCQTPASQIVRLPHVSKSQFTYVGYTDGTVPFELELTACTRDLAGIEYKLVPSYLQTSDWTKTHANGTLPLSSKSSASGVSVQVLDGDKKPVVFDETSRTTLASYKKGDTSANIPLYAQYIQTGQHVKSGSVYASMTVLYLYK